MKKGLLGSTALIGATALLAGAAGAAEAPTWKLTGNVNFQFYNVDQDFVGYDGSGSWATTTLSGISTPQDHGWYFGVDESELALNVSGTADNGLNYGFKIEIQTNTTDGTVADEARLQLSGGWGTLQMGDEDGAEDVLNVGGESLMGATGGFDGDKGDVLIRQVVSSSFFLAPSGPTIAGDTSDMTKISYFSPSFSGFKAGISLTPTMNDGDSFKSDGDFEDAIGLGANYDNSFGNIRVRASAVYAMAASTNTGVEDIGAWSVGGVVGFGPASIGANYADNGESGQPTGSGFETSYWDVAASFETGPMSFSAGYFASTKSFGVLPVDDSTFTMISLTADYTVAPGLGVYAEIDMVEDDLMGGILTTWYDNDATIFIMGANVSF